MNKKLNNYEKFYSLTIIFTLIVLSFGATFAYFTATVESDENDIETGSKTYSLNLSVIPKYPNIEEEFYTLIPMKDNLVETAYSDTYKCKDKNNAGACYAYSIKVYEYNEDLDYVSGTINIETSNVTNLSYMIYDEDDNPSILWYDEETASNIYKNKIISGETETLGEEGFNVSGKSELNLTLVIWLSDINETQNSIDIGTFNGSVTFATGKGGTLTGNISSAIIGNYTG